MDGFPLWRRRRRRRRKKKPNKICIAENQSLGTQSFQHEQQQQHAINKTQLRKKT